MHSPKILLLILLLLITGCGSIETTENTLNLRATGDPKSFNPILANETTTTAITNRLFEGLVKTNGVTQEVEPHLAHSWEMSPNGKTWIFYLEPDVRWSDDNPFTAHDVKFTFDRLIYNKSIPTSLTSIFTINGKQIQTTVIDDLTVKFTLPEPFAPFLRSLDMAILPKHHHKQDVDKGIFPSTLTLSTSPKDIVTTGPWFLESYTPAQHILLTRNQNYWLGQKHGEQIPKINALSYTIIPNQEVALLSFLEGKTDLYGVRGVDFPILNPMQETKQFTIHRLGPAFGTNFLTFNLNIKPENKTLNTLFNNRTFRQAIAHSIDKEAIINLVHNGLGSKQIAAMSKSAKQFYNENVQTYPFDLKKANALLTSIGLVDQDQDGFLEAQNGKEITFTIKTNSGSSDRIQIANIIRKDLVSIGLDAHVHIVDFNALVSQLTETRDFDAVIIGFTGGIEPHFGASIWKSDGMLHLWNPKQSTPGTEWEAEIDTLFERGSKTLNIKERKAIYHRWQEVVATELPLIYTTLPESIIAIRDRVKNANPTAYGGALHNLEYLELHD